MIVDDSEFVCIEYNGISHHKQSVSEIIRIPSLRELEIIDRKELLEQISVKEE